jgi:hypothetical protein
MKQIAFITGVRLDGFTFGRLFYYVTHDLLYVLVQEKKLKLIEMSVHFFLLQLAQLLPMEENFLLLFRFDNPLESSVEFMKVSWNGNEFSLHFVHLLDFFSLSLKFVV